MRQSTIPADIGASRTAFRFVLLIGVLSFFADFTYEGSRSILGPFLASLQASGAVVGLITGFGELLGYGLRLVSGRLADATGQFWPITIFGYVVQMAAVPAHRQNLERGEGLHKPHGPLRRNGTGDCQGLSYRKRANGGIERS